MEAIITSEKGGLGASSPVLMADRSIMLCTVQHVQFVWSLAYVQYHASVWTEHPTQARFREKAQPPQAQSQS